MDSGIRYRFNVQARYEVGFDDEMLDLLRQAGFFELDLGIEFLDDASFATYHKKSTRQEIIDAIRNIRAHGLSVRGLFILGSDDQEAGVGDQLADFVIQNHIQGTLIQCMYFVPGTPVYEANRDRLLHQDWSKYNGNAVHFPRRMTPYQLQLEHIRASRKIYSWRRLFSALVREDPIHKLLFFGGIFLAHERAQRSEKGDCPTSSGSPNRPRARLTRGAHAQPVEKVFSTGCRTF